MFNCFYINRMENGTLLDLVVKENKALTYVKAKTLVKELASCVQVSY